MGTLCMNSMSPVSSPASICMMVTPVSVSPASMARWIGAAPRQRGSSEAWMLKQPKRRHIQHPLRQDQAVGGHHHDIGTGGQDGLARRGRVVGILAVQAQAARLGHRDVRAPAQTA